MGAATRSIALGVLAVMGSVGPAAGAAKAKHVMIPPWARSLEREARTVGKPDWRPMLEYDVRLHVVDTHPAEPPFIELVKPTPAAKAAFTLGHLRHG